MDPEVFIFPLDNQVEHLVSEIEKQIKKKERTLVTTLTKKMADSLSKYFLDLSIKSRYIHADIDTLERLTILKELREGTIDVVVGVNLLREGLDLPEVSLVAILDADKEGFLRNQRSLIQTMGRAARNINGRVFLYANKITDSMEKAITETKRRRDKQALYNKKHNITPQSVKRVLKDLSDTSDILVQLKGKKEIEPKIEHKRDDLKEIARENLKEELLTLEEEMKQAAAELNFEKAAELRDKLKELS